MMTPSPIKSAVYYENLAAEDYFENGGEPAGQWQGTGSNTLSLNGPVQDAQLKMMLEGFNPRNGCAVASNAGSEHRPGHDLCFSAPKSVSTIWASSSAELRQQIQEAQAQAISKSIEYIEENIAHVRRGKGGCEHESAHIIAASYEHSTSRAQDPQLHTHLLVSSHAIGQETGDVRSLDSCNFYKSQKAIGAVYRAELAHQMRALGFQVERDGQSFRIVGSDKSLEQAWSKRRHDVERQLKLHGTGGAKASEAAALSSRATKQAVNRTELFDRWQNEAIELGFDVEEIQFKDDLEFDTPKFDISAILHAATEHQAVFSQAHLHALIAQELQGVGGADEMHYRLQLLESSGELINLGKHKHVQQYTTREMLLLERQIIDFAVVGREKNRWKVPTPAINRAIELKQGISKEQQAALKHICGKGQVVSVTGAAGVGKSFMLAAAKLAMQEAGLKVTGCSLSGKAAAELQAGSDIQSQTIHSLLHEIDSGQRLLSNKDVLVMDEAGMTDTRLMHRITEAIQQAGAKLILVGDTAQLQSIGAGGTFGKLSAEIGSAEILEVRRQKIAWQKQAANNFRLGRAGEALAAYKQHGALHIRKSVKDAHQLMIDRWRSIDSPATTKTMIAGRRADVAKLNRLARRLLKENNEICVEVTTVTTDRDGNESKTKIAEGERLKLTKNSKSLGVMNGDLATVKSINMDNYGNVILDIQLDRTDEIIRINSSEYSSFTHGYCITAHASQGATVDHTLFYASSFNSKEMAYVSASRQRCSCEIFASEEEVGEAVEQSLAHLMSVSDQKVTAMEQLENSSKAESFMSQNSMPANDDINQQSTQKKQENPLALSM